MFKKILAVGAHPDDVELGCSGTLLKYQAQGSHIDIVVCRDDNAPKPSVWSCLLYTSPSPRDATLSRMPSSA